MSRFPLAVCLTLLAGTVHAEPLKIGLVAPLSGAGAGWGIAMRGGAELAAENINAAGGLKIGDTTYEVEIVAYDDQYRASEAVNAVNRLIYEDEVKTIFGPLGSAPIVALLPTTTENKIITISAAFASQVVSTDAPYSYRAVLPTAVFSTPQINWVINGLGAKKVGGLFPNDESGQQVAADVVNSYKQAGATFDSVEFFERERVDFIPLLTRILATGIDTFELDGNSPQTAGLIVKQLRELGFKGNIIRTGGDATAEILEVAGPAASEGIYLHQAYDPANAEVQAYRDKFEERYRIPMNAFSPFFYETANMIFESMQAAGTTTDTDAITKAMADLSGRQGAFGEATWIGADTMGANRQLYMPYYIAKLAADGKPEIVAECDATSCK